jgi:hypothetical protein
MDVSSVEAIASVNAHPCISAADSSGSGIGSPHRRLKGHNQALSLHNTMQTGIEASADRSNRGKKK